MIAAPSLDGSALQGTQSNRKTYEDKQLALGLLAGDSALWLFASQSKIIIRSSSTCASTGETKKLRRGLDHAQASESSPAPSKSTMVQTGTTDESGTGPFGGSDGASSVECCRADVYVPIAALQPGSPRVDIVHARQTPNVRCPPLPGRWRRSFRTQGNHRRGV